MSAPSAPSLPITIVSGGKCNDLYEGANPIPAPFEKFTVSLEILRNQQILPIRGLKPGDHVVCSPTTANKIHALMKQHLNKKQQG